MMIPSLELRPKILYFLVIILLQLIVPSCFVMPNGGFERNKKSNCIYFITGTMEIEQKCSDGDFHDLTDLSISVEYDSVKMVNNHPSSSYLLFEEKGKINLPYKLDTILKDKSKKISISIGTEVRGSSYHLAPQEKNWRTDTLFFTYFYNNH